tara:strand:+ start:355 stop:936 length:582 start_codon:yes stop_codon:yes gene_type:complete
MQTNKIITHLQNTLTPFKELKEYSDNPGIYAVGFIGESFPFPSRNNLVRNGNIIYIGKTEKSQRSRDAMTHFKSGRTGSSTLRRSLGAILLQELELTPIPRNNTESKMRDYKFIRESEEKLTQWMINNLSLSFYEILDGKKVIKELEKQVIITLSPVLNIQGNSILNPYAGMLKELRAKCKQIAKAQYIGKVL